MCQNPPNSYYCWWPGHKNIWENITPAPGLLHLAAESD
eukprot:SAG22_NODE_688_length_7907_cov_7.557505_4_plen_38_part_00